MKKRRLNRDLNQLKNGIQKHPWKINQLPSRIFAKYHYAMRAMGISDQNYYKHLRSYSNELANVNKSIHANHDKIPKGLYPISNGYGEDIPNNPKKALITPKKLVKRINKFQKKLPKMNYKDLRNAIYNSTYYITSVGVQPHNNLQQYKRNYKRTHHIPIGHIKWNDIKRRNQTARKWIQGRKGEFNLAPSEDKFEKDMSNLKTNFDKTRDMYFNSLSSYNAANDYTANNSSTFRPYDEVKKSSKNVSHQLNLTKYQYHNSKHVQPKLNTIKDDFGYSENDIYNGTISQLQQAKHFYHKAVNRMRVNVIKPHYQKYFNYEKKHTYHGKIANKLDQHPNLAKSMNLYSGKQAKNRLNKNINGFEKTLRSINQANSPIVKRLQKAGISKSKAKNSIKKIVINSRAKLHQVKPYQVYSGENLQAGKLTPINNKGIKQLISSVKNTPKVKNVFSQNKVNNYGRKDFGHIPFKTGHQNKNRNIVRENHPRR